MHNAKRWMKCCKAHRHRTLEKSKFSGVMNYTSQSGSLMDELGLTNVRKKLPIKMHNANSLVEEGGIGLFLGFEVRPLSSIEGNVNAKAFIDILDKCMHPTMWQHFEEGNFLFQNDCHCAKVCTVKS